MNYKLKLAAVSLLLDLRDEQDIETETFWSTAVFETEKMVFIMMG